MQDELRPVTVLFADIVGSTALGERLAPDEVKALVGECVTRMSRAVEEFGGTVQAYQGDGVCAYFGVPAAHADDPERAARAALRILALVQAHAADIRAAWGIDRFDVRVGVNSGQMAVGVVGSDSPQAVALGDATNVAARLESLAEPGTIVVGEATAGRLERRFVLEERGAATVKGRAKAVRAWLLVGARPETHQAAKTPLVGREDELSRIGAVLEDLATGRGGVLLLEGEDGTGKSRLLDEGRNTVADRVTWLTGSSPSYGHDLVYAPFVEVLRGWLGAVDGEPEIAVRTKARARLGSVLGDARLIAVLTRLAGAKVDEPDAGECTVEDAYGAWVAALASRRPLVIALDDAQWLDAVSRRLAEALLELTDRLPLVLAIAQAPQPGSEGWALRTRALSDYSHRVCDVSLGPLPADAASELVRLLVPGLGAGMASTLVAQAEGNPLYLEELLRQVVEGSGLDRRRTWTVTVGTAEVLPPALEGLLVARLDRLSPAARHFAQVAAVVGRTFQVGLVERIAGDAGALPELLRAEVVREVRRYPEFECAFAHRLLQDAALSSLTSARRKALYGEVAAAFEELYASSLDEHLERLAHYYAQSDNGAAALRYLQRAAERAAELGAGDQAERLRARARALAQG